MHHGRPVFLYLLFTVTAIAIVMVWTASLAEQAETATLVGPVCDESGAVVANVRIWLTDNSTSVRHESSTSKDGRFAVPGLEPGIYTLRAQADGFAVVEIPNLVLKSRSKHEVHLKLKPGTEKHNSRESLQGLTKNAKLIVWVSTTSAWCMGQRHRVVD